MTIRNAALTCLLLAAALALFAPAALAETDSSRALNRNVLPAGEVTWTQVAGACGPCASPCGVARNAVCCDFRDWESCDWHFRVSIGSWIAGMDGTLGVRGRQFDLDMSVNDSLSAFFDYGEALLQGRVGVSKGRFSLEGQYSGMRFGKAAKVGTGGFGLDNTLTLQQFGVRLLYRVAETKLGCGPCPMLLVWEPLIGMRGNNMKLQVEAPTGGSASQSQVWMDPVVGARITWDLRNRWAFMVDGDVGGFDVASKLTWRVAATVSYRFSRLFSLTAGWVLLDTDYTTGTGNERFIWDVQQSGPMIMANFSF